MAVVSVSMPDELIERLDEFAADHEYTGRSEVVRESARTLLSEFENEQLAGRELAAIVTVLYDFDTQHVERRVTELRHEYEERISSTDHSHVDDYCLDCFVLETDLEDVSTFVGRIRSIERVKTVEYSLVPLDAVDAIGERGLHEN
ncbi:CopG family ribbon-helix-helix protein [Halostagnicola sp. A-GB9-2]|uniref:CopG family ribbon-helix-helix protein n=1 Tax=Halostagnicola sp. A-GB9-2 TaxID=3048066 RepID=UPI0024BF4BB2|nr:CopG family ribbon-helix-helix protein [Halostagnicola sp. A-GB9-2]MDJ1431360.1 CopG family ribbon-helix-helix protein [Halostagnicola sp. A-GB9-2]